MSFLRALSAPRRANSYQREEPTLVLRVADYGFLYLTRIVQPFGPNDLESGYVNEPFSLRGALQINIPAGHGRCRCKSLSVLVRTKCRLAMGPHRGWEEDVIFEREEKLKDAEGIWFEEGLTKFEFAFTLPYNFPAMDWHDTAKVRHDMHAIVEGIPAQSYGSRFLQSFRSSSPGPSRERSPPVSRSHSRSPSPPIGEMSSLRLDTPSIALSSGPSRLPQTPSYEEAAAGPSNEAQWLEGTFDNQKVIRIYWNPNVTGGLNSLDEKVRDTGGILGDFEVYFQAPIWSVCCLLHTRVHFPHIPSSVTIFHVRVELVQTLVVRSPREKGPDAEAKALRTSRRLLISSEGKRPPKDVKRPDVWRDPQAGPDTVGEFQVVMKGRLPNDLTIRPSTLDGIVTPVHVSHHLFVEVGYSVWSQDENGLPLPKPGPGDQRTLSIGRSVILPACTLIPERVSLPEYASVSKARLTLPNEPCPLCRMIPEDRFCTSCAYEIPVHPRHDHPPKLVGSADGICPVCSITEQHEGNNQWHNCACAMSDAEIERLGDNLQKVGGAGAVQRFGEGGDGQKEEYERGRQL